MDQNSPPVPKFSSKSFYTPLIISLFGIASSALMILVYQFLILKFCMRTRNTAASDTAAVGTSEISAATGGVDEKLLDTIPILAYSPENRDLFLLDQTECAVCLGELEEEEMVRLLPSCKHAFHMRCIDQWFMGHVSCPLCRSPVGEPSEATIVVLPVEVRSEVRDGENEATMGENINASSIIGGARVSIRHSASMVFARERREKGLLEGNLKRSLSMDQSFLVIDVERESERACSSSSSSSSAKDDVTRRGSYTTSSRLLRSFSRLRAARVGSGDGNGNGMVLPC